MLVVVVMVFPVAVVVVAVVVVVVVVVVIVVVLICSRRKLNFAEADIQQNNANSWTCVAVVPMQSEKSRMKDRQTMSPSLTNSKN